MWGLCLCVCACARIHTHFPSAPHLIKRSPLPMLWPKSFSHHRSTAFTSQTQSLVGVGRHRHPPPQKTPGQTPESPSPGCPSHSPIWILLGKLAPTTAPRKPVQKKAKMCCIFLFALAKKKPRSNHRFGVSPLPCIPLSVLPVLFLLQFLPSSLPSFLPSARCVSLGIRALKLQR